MGDVCAYTIKGVKIAKNQEKEFIIQKENIVDIGPTWEKGTSTIGQSLGYENPGGGVLNFGLGTDVRPEVSTTTL